MLVLYFVVVLPVNAISTQVLNPQIVDESYVHHNTKDSLILEYHKRIPGYLEAGDTAKVIDCWMDLIIIYSGMGEFSKAYEGVWEVMPLVEEPKFIEKKIELYNKLIGLYLVYDQHRKAIQSYNQLPGLIENAQIDSLDRIKYLGRFYSLGAWIELKTGKDLAKAERLSLKANDYNEKWVGPGRLHHTQVQLANIYNQQGEAEKAWKVLSRENKRIPLPLKPEHALLYFRMAEYYDLVQKPDSSMFYYEQSLTAINHYNTLSDKTPLILERLAKLNAQKGNYQLAYQQSLEAAKSNQAMFSTQQLQNKELFEIKDRYQEQVKEQERQIQQQQFSILTKANSLFRFRAYSIIVSLVLLGIVIFIFQQRKSNKKINLQALINQKQKLEIEKQEEILEARNKELLGSAMQLIERENEQAKIKKQLAQLKVEGENASILQQIQNDLRIDKSQKWKEFESRFIAVNNAFFDSLKAQYPKLTPTDLKMCAFVKLGFSSKDMAQIMGITVEGINTTRSRLRRKMKLKREVILSDFLSNTAH